MTVLRRFEIYSLRADAPAERVAGLRRALRDCGRFIPEVRDSAVGTNRTDAPLQLVWEHAYDSPDAYRRYMQHPFHACVLDRFLLADSPERIVSDNALGAGLAGYACDGEPYRLRAGVRRLVLLRLRDGARDGEVQRLRALAEAEPARVPGMAVSILAENTFATRWFDGVTPVSSRPPAWTHLWEQGFESIAALEAHRACDSELARAERDGWSAHGDGLVLRSLALEYEIEPGST